MNRPHPKPRSEGEEGPRRLDIFVRREVGKYFITPLYSFLNTFFCSEGERTEGGREGGDGIGGVTTDVLPPSESCLFDGDSGAYHVA